jgi:hypothetical protein
MNDQEKADLKLIGPALTDTTPLPLLIFVTEILRIIPTLRLAAMHPKIHDGLKKRILTAFSQYNNAFIERHPDALERFNAGDLEPILNLNTQETLVVQTTFGDAWITISAIQLVCRHPELPEDIRKSITNTARQLQAAIIKKHPEVTAILERGWNEKYDVDIQ